MNRKPDTSLKNSIWNPSSMTRREFIKLGILSTSGLAMTLLGCTPGNGQNAQYERQVSVVDAWLEALNGEDSDSFTDLLSESVVATTHFKRDPVSGREHIWELYQTSTGNQIEKIIQFGQDQAICLLTNATKFNRSLCHVFNFEDNLIDKIYEYESGSYYLATSPDFSGFEGSSDDTGIQDRLDAMDAMFIDGLNNRDFTLPDVIDQAIMFVPTSKDPIIGKEKIVSDGESYANFYNSVSHKKIQTFGQGNLVCTHVMADRTPKGSLCFVAVFDSGGIAELYEFWSDAK